MNLKKLNKYEDSVKTFFKNKIYSIKNLKQKKSRLIKYYYVETLKCKKYKKKCRSLNSLVINKQKNNTHKFFLESCSKNYQPYEDPMFFYKIKNFFSKQIVNKRKYTKNIVKINKKFKFIFNIFRFTVDLSNIKYRYTIKYLHFKNYYSLIAKNTKKKKNFTRRFKKVGYKHKNKKVMLIFRNHPFLVKYNKVLTEKKLEYVTLLNKKLIQNHLLSHYYTFKKVLVDKKKITKNLLQKNYKYKKKKLVTLNAWRGLFKGFKESRKTHWSFYTPKTIKIKRYQNFLVKDLKNTPVKNNTILVYFMFKFKLSYSFWKNFNNFIEIFYKNSTAIFQIPISLVFWKFLFKIQKNKKKIEFKINSWVRKTIKIKKTFWMEKKKKTPKFFSKQVYWNNKIFNSIQYDFITNYFIVYTAKNQNKFLSIEKIIKNNKFLKLHNFRYVS